MCAIRATEARVSHIMSTSAARVLLLCLVAASVARPLRGQRVWDEFYESRQRAPPLEATLPDYSYAGYRYSDRPIPSTPIAGRPVFNVADYGAVADDDVDDAAGIQSAIDACARSDAGGVIQLNVGRYTVSSNADRGTLPELVLHGSHCVLRGVARNLTNIVIQHHKVYVSVRTIRKGAWASAHACNAGQPDLCHQGRVQQGQRPQAPGERNPFVPSGNLQRIGRQRSPSACRTDCGTNVPVTRSRGCPRLPADDLPLVDTFGHAGHARIRIAYDRGS